MYNLPRLSYKKPTNLTFEDCGRLIEVPAPKVLKDNKIPETVFPTFYIQVSPKRSKPEWIELSYFFVRVFNVFLTDPSFIKNCLKLFDNTKGYIKRGNLIPISKLMKNKIKELKLKKKGLK